MRMESIDLVDEERQDVQEEATEKHHGVQEYMKKKKEDILQRLAEEGRCRITSMWTNLTTLQPMFDDILNEIPETEVKIEINIVKKLTPRSSVAIVEGDMDGKKHNIDEAEHEEATSPPSGRGQQERKRLKQKSTPNLTPDHHSPPEKKQCSSPSGITDKATPAAAVQDGCGVLMRPWLLAMKLEVYEEKAKVWIAENGPCNLKEVASS